MRTRTRRTILALTGCVTSLLLAACGGGGGTDDPIALRLADEAWQTEYERVQAACVPHGGLHEVTRAQTFTLLDESGMEYTRVVLDYICRDGWETRTPTKRPPPQ